MTQPFELTISLGLRSGDQPWGTERRMALLAAIHSEGSIRAAAHKVGMSYKAAWDAVNLMNRASGQLLVERTTGGAGGGGARLTTQARDLLAWFQALQEAQQRFMARLAQNGRQGHDQLHLLQGLALQTSARNRFAGTVLRVEAPDPVNHLIHLALGSAQTLRAVITQASTVRLGLAPGAQALAIIKAQSVHVWAPPDAMRRPGATPKPHADTHHQASAWNQWPGQVEHCKGSAGRTEVCLDVGRGLHVTGLTTAPPDAPALQIGRPAMAGFRADDVLLAAPDPHPHGRGEDAVDFSNA